MKCWNPNCGYDALADNAIFCPECMTDRPRAASSTQRDANWWRCHDTDSAGNRCSKAGTRHPSTMNRGPSGKGDDGPWYCAAHDPQSKAALTTAAPPPMGFAALHQVIAKFGKGPSDPKQWARDILNRQGEGDRTLSPLQIQMAKDALGVGAFAPRQREPGEEG